MIGTQQQVDWRSAHDRLSRMAKERARLDCEEGGLLLQALRSHVHLHLGFASFVEYVERLFGYSPRWTQERLRVAESLESLPRLQAALRDASVPWSTARELSRVASPESEQAWLDVARGKTMRQVEQLVAGHRPGDLPDDAPDTSLARHVLRAEVSAETFATFREPWPNFDAIQMALSMKTRHFCSWRVRCSAAPPTPVEPATK